MSSISKRKRKSREAKRNRAQEKRIIIWTISITIIVLIITYIAFIRNL